MDRSTLEAAWLTLTRETLPRLASNSTWPVSADHCFQRILLDHAVGGCWYDHVAGRPAYRHLDAGRLAAAVGLGERVVAGEADLPALNRQSLAWRANTGPTLRSHVFGRAEAALSSPRAPGTT